MRIHDDTGAEIDATFSVEIQQDGSPSIVFESRSGRAGQGAGRNTDYKRGLRLILDRLLVSGFTINAIFLDTTVTRGMGMTEDERRIPIDPHSYPILPTHCDLTADLAAALGRGMAPIASRRQRNSSGDQTRRIRMDVTPSQGWNDTAGSIEALLANAPVQRKYFALLASPSTYDLRAASAALSMDYWIVASRAAKRGDRLIFWQTMDRERHRGVVAFGEVTEPATERGPDPAGARFWKSGTSRPELALRIGVRYVVPPKTPLWLDDDPSGTLAGLSVSRGQGNTLFLVTDAQWDAVVDLAGGWPHGDADAGHSISPDQPEPVPQTASGQGRSSNAARNKAIELRAMDVVTAHYTAQGWQVTDTSATHPYDLVCTDPSGHDIFVEVKGTGGTGSTVTVTEGEISHARNHPTTTFLAVVSGIIAGPAPSYTATGGALSHLEPWDPDAGTLEPTQYRFTPSTGNPQN